MADGKDGNANENGRITWNLSLLAQSFFATFTCMLVAHGYRWFNASSASHDGLAIANLAREAPHQVSLGRFFVPVYTALRGAVAAPYLVGIISSVFIATSVYFVAKLINTKHPASIWGLSAALSTSTTVTFLNATYTNWLDVDMLALLLSVLAVYLAADRRSPFVGGLALAASLGLYQSYLQMFVGLALVVVFYRSIIRGRGFRSVVCVAASLGVALLVGACLYVAAMKASMALFSVQPTSGYNGLAGVGDYSGESIAVLAIKAYITPIAYMLSPETHVPLLAGIANLVAIGCIALAFFRTATQRQWRNANTTIAALCLLALPLACNMVYVISHGVMHGLMIHSYSLLYVLAIAATSTYTEKPQSGDVRDGKTSCFSPAFPTSTALATALSLVFALNIVYANDLYVRKDLESQATLSTISRIVDRLEQTEGYEPGSTKVAIVGSLDKSPIAFNRPGFPTGREHILLESLTGQLHATGSYGSYAVTYPQTYDFYFTYVLGYPVNLANESETSQLEKRTEVQQMDAFPASDCIDWIGDTIVVKLS